MELIHPLADAYAEKHTSSLDNLLQEMEHDTMASHPHAHMLSGKVQGRILQSLSQMIQPKYILEIGTFTGFSALCLAEGLQENGELHTLELREADINTARHYFEKSVHQKKIKIHHGDAINIIPTLNFEWDIVFLDADKINYVAYYDLVIPQMRSGGWLIADNVLFHGQVLEEEIAGKNALAINAFNHHVSLDKRTEQVMLTVRDGLFLVRKL